MSDDGLGELGRLAGALGVQTAYWDTRGHRRVARPDVLVAVLSSLGAPIDHPDRLDDLRMLVDRQAATVLEPVVVHWSPGAIVEISVCLSVEHDRATALSWAVTTETGGVVDGVAVIDGEAPVDRRWAGGRAHPVHRFALTGTEGLPVGYHRLFVEVVGLGYVASLIVAPRRVVRPAPSERTWGVVAGLYALPEVGGTGSTVRSLDEIGRWIDPLGGRVVATLPILASYLDEPCDFSPYTPISQRFWNEAFLDVGTTPELAASPLARRLVESVSAEVANAGRPGRFDHRGHYRRIRPVLEELARTFFAAPASTRERFERWLADDPAAGAYAAFRAATDQTRSGWHSWQVGPGQLPAGVEVDGELARFHLYVQWTMREQLADVARALEGRDQRLYLDLPVGAHGDGFDTWVDPQLYGWGCSVGAPPDDFFGDGQNWGFPPISPQTARAQGHGHLAAALRHHMSVAGILRLDHVMGFERLFWVPDGADARDGVYVRYPRDELFAVLCVESERNDCRVVGEDLGTVTDEVREAVDRHGLLGMYVGQFRLPGDDGVVPSPTAHQVAGIDTHDTPTFAGWMQGADIAGRRERGEVDADQERRLGDERRRDVDRLVAALRRTGRLGAEGSHPQLLEVLRAVLCELGESPAAALLVGVDDLLLEVEPQNVPGTGLDRPNWVQMLRRTVTELAADPDVRVTLERVQAARLSAHLRALEDSP